MLLQVEEHVYGLTDLTPKYIEPKKFITLRDISTLVLRTTSDLCKKYPTHGGVKLQLLSQWVGGQINFEIWVHLVVIPGQ